MRYLTFSAGTLNDPSCWYGRNSSISESSMGDGFERIVNVLRKIERQDIEWDLDEIFELRLN